MKFKIKASNEIYDFIPFYDKKEHSITTKPFSPCDFSISFGTYTVIDFTKDNNSACAIIGYCPFNICTEMDLEIPSYIKGTLIVTSDFSIGSCVNYNNIAKTYFDKEKGIICIGNCSYDENIQTVEFNTNTYATLHNDELVCIWIKF